MTYEEASAQVAKEKVTANFMQLSFGWSCTLILPHKEGLVLLEALRCAEQLENSTDHIQGIAMSAFTVTFLSPEQYRRHKMATLMRISLKELNEPVQDLPF